MGAGTAAVIVACITAVQAIAVAVISHKMTRKEKDAGEYRKQRELKEREREKADKERERARKELDVAILGLMFANAEGNEVLLHQAHGEQVNGNVDEALSHIQKAKSRCNEVINKAAIG